MSETGSVKFTADRTVEKLSDFPAFAELNLYRSKIRHLHLLGVDEEGIGFGNLSVRDAEGSSQFYITGSGTGRKESLEITDCARVIAFDLSRNWLEYAGPTVASSESLTHASIYAADPSVNAIIHGHDFSLWTKLLAELPSTPAAVDYGTPAMAHAVAQLFQTTDVRAKHGFAMAGHREGVIFFGTDLEEAFSAITKFRN